jgi:hypothetical protein
MTTSRALILGAITLALSIGDPAAAGEKASKADAKAKSSSAPAVNAAPPNFLAAVQYIAPKGGRPARTVAGATRGAADRMPALYVLVPDHVGYTTSAQPSLFYFVDGAPPAGTQVEFTLIDDESIEPNVKATLPAPTSPGIQRVDLTKHGFNLKPGVEYEWSISILVDPDDPAKDVVATGWIQRTERSSDLSARIGTAKPDETIGIYAGEGLWYDALTSLGDQIASNPDDPQLTQARANLLKQVGLDKAAQ